MSENIIEALPSEKILDELQQKKAQRLGRGTGTSDVAQSDLSSGTPSAVDEDGKSISSESYVHASQMASSGVGNGESRPARSKAQLWGELKISCTSYIALLVVQILSSCSYHKSIYTTIYNLSPQPSNSDTT